ncbi:MAG TPA: adenosylcobinamide-phosphate synthase CbiB [Candidatus Omnitrophota bacterium]|nr:adenosylcobinamide-phosphate synthase CbiB [Candidatus Omnitrophota bacterium]
MLLLSTIDYRLSTILAAYILDLIIGDPRIPWHPTRIIGRLIERLERKLNPVTPRPKGVGFVGCNGVNIAAGNKKFVGIILIILVVPITMLCVWLVLELTKNIHIVLYYIASILFIYFALSIKSLGQEVNKVKLALSNKDIVEARKSLAMIVARDTDNLDEQNIIRATVETTAESTMDGIIAVLFFSFLGGAVLVWGYKAVNTLDSMVGYRNKRFLDFGWAAAKLDTLVNFIPAKLTCLFIFVSSLLLGRYRVNSGRWFSKYIFKGPFYNSEATEAVMAGALGVQLGGENFYDVTPVKKNFIGDNLFPLEIRHIGEAVKIAYLSSALFVSMGIFLIWLPGRG